MEEIGKSDSFSSKNCGMVSAIPLILVVLIICFKWFWELFSLIVYYWIEPDFHDLHFIGDEN